MQQLTCLFAILTLLIPVLGCANSNSKSSLDFNLPTKNPYLADSDFPMLHGTSANAPISSYPGPVDVTRRVESDELIYKSLGVANGPVIHYTGPYPDGRRAIIAGGSDRLMKLDMETLETLSTYAMGGRFYTEEETERYVDELDAMIPAAETDWGKWQELIDHLTETMIVPWRSTAWGIYYQFTSHENEQFLVTMNTETNESFINVFGDAIPGDIESPLVRKRQWKIPSDGLERFRGLAMVPTYDGRIILLTSDGRLFSLAWDFSEYDMIRIPFGDTDETSKDFMSAYIRNGVAIDDDGGIYIVSLEHMIRVQWTGEKLSLDEEDGAWRVPYNGGHNGSGSTPSLLGWGDEDKLVTILDGLGEPSVNVYWRDEIPEDWEGLEGHPRRLAGTVKMDFGGLAPDNNFMEASSTVFGHSIFVANETPLNGFPEKGAKDERILARLYGTVHEDFVAAGGVRVDWHPETRELKQTWNTDAELLVVCSYSVNGLIYCSGRKDNEHTIHALNAETGEVEFIYLLGKSYRNSSSGAVVRISPNGDIDCPCGAGNGMIRIRPNKTSN